MIDYSKPSLALYQKEFCWVFFFNAKPTITEKRHHGMPLAIVWLSTNSFCLRQCLPGWISLLGPELDTGIPWFELERVSGAKVQLLVFLACRKLLLHTIVFESTLLPRRKKKEIHNYHRYTLKFTYSDAFLHKIDSINSILLWSTVFQTGPHRWLLLLCLYPEERKCF